MTFLWPKLLFSLAALPVLVALYVWVLRRRKRGALQYAHLAIVKQAMGRGPSWRRHLPALLLLLALAAMLVSLGRPAAVILLPAQHETVVLAMDVSGSMRAADVEPTRIAAAQAAAKAFVADQPSSTKIAVVTFAGTAAVVQPPTQNREDIAAALDRFQLQRGTAIGSGLLVSLKLLFPDVEFDLRSQNPRARPPRSGPIDPARPAKEPFKPVPPGSYTSAVIVLLTDGQTTTGPDPIEAARMAAERGVKVYTVGVGTTKGEVLRTEGWSFRVSLDEDTLKKIAGLTHGEYFYAGNATDLRKIYESLNSRFTMERQETEVTALFAALAALLAIAAATLSLLWFNRVV